MLNPWDIEQAVREFPGLSRTEAIVTYARKYSGYPRRWDEAPLLCVDPREA